MNDTDWNPVLTEGTFKAFLSFVEQHPVTDWNKYLPGCFDPPLHTILVHRKDDPMPFVRYLVERGADVNKPLDDGIRPIHAAAMRPTPNCLQYFLRLGALVNQTNFDDDPWRPIHAAAWAGCTETTRALVKLGAFVDSVNRYGDTPISIATGNKDANTLALLATGLPGPPRVPSADSPPVLYLFIGIPASGKSTFYRRVLADRNLDYVSLDTLGTRAREKAAFEAALAARRSVAVDNTNVTKALRARYFAPAKAAGYRTVGLFFQSVLADCLTRNEAREGKAKVKRLAVLGMSAHLELPSLDEGFDRLFFVRISDGLFEIEPWKES